jgi:protein-export membrane protein SecD
MLHFTRWKVISILAICLLGILACVPNFLSKEGFESLPASFQNKIGLGLDLRGGAHLLMSMDTNEVRKGWASSLRGDARKALRDAKIGFAALGVEGGAVQVKLSKPEEMDAALKELRKLIQPIGNAVLGKSGDDIEVKQGTEAGSIVISPTELGIQNRISNALSSSIEVMRTRIDGSGTKEANIVRQGSDRILVQVPGVEDTKSLLDLLGSTAKLSFHDVNSQVSVEDAKLTKVPAGYKIYDAAPGERGDASYLLKEEPVVDGDDLVDAQPGFDSRNTAEPVIHFRFNQRGALKFGNFTKENVGRPFAIVLDDKVLSAPVIRDAILGGSGQISCSFTVDSANKLAVQLRSGALPAKLSVVEERTVGASLGQDSIDSGKRAALIGMLGVAAFMIFAYGLFGFFAVIGAALHVVLVLAIMSLIGSTMTLPGIAGVVLTIGMAVDANVLIYERIREELRAGKTPIMAIEQGFARAYATILDSQSTTFIAGLVMFWLGSGPIRGFAITLTLGILTTVFTAFTVTRLLVSWWVARQKGKKIEAPLSYNMVRT